MWLLKFNMNPLMLISTLVTSYIFIVEGQSSCTTPSGEVSSCVSLLDCSELLSIAENPNKSQKNIDDLRTFFCGFEGNTPRVCCPAQNQTKFQSLPPERNPNFNPDLIKDCNGIPGVLPPHPYSGCCGIQAGEDDPTINGNITNVYKHPWLVQIEYFKDQNIRLLCGGALISNRYVLTAAHCVTGEVLTRGTPRNVRLGEFDTSNEVHQVDCVNYEGGRNCTDGAVVIPIETIIPHPDYNPNGLYKNHDIALLRINTSASYSEFIRPICLPTSDMTLSPPPDWQLIAAGWDNVNEAHVSNVKLETELPFVPEDYCLDIHTYGRRFVFLGQGQMCAGIDMDEESCTGDSGGPLMSKNRKGKKFYELVGIASFGQFPSIQCDDVPGLYTKVYDYISWIRQTVKP